MSSLQLGRFGISDFTSFCQDVLWVFLAVYRQGYEGSEMGSMRPRRKM
jgi:hypothetical protein